jgi:hypothetical protein
MFSTYAALGAQSLNAKWPGAWTTSKNAYVSDYLFCNVRAVTRIITEYRGPPDPLRGDEIYKRVRDAAKVSAGQ